MGNAEILRSKGVVGGPVIEVPKAQVIWIVYLLRDQGKKRTAEEVKRTGQTGLLEIWRSYDGRSLTASLVAISGFPTLENLYDARLLQGTRDGGLLFRGTTMSVKAGDVLDIPQAWWCVVHAIRPLPPPG